MGDAVSGCPVFAIPSFSLSLKTGLNSSVMWGYISKVFPDPGMPSPPAHGAHHLWTPTTKRSASANPRSLHHLPSARPPWTRGTESPPPPRFLSDDCQRCMCGEGHKIHIPATLKQHAQSQIKLHSKTGTEFPLEEEAELLQRKNLKERKSCCLLCSWG